MIAHECFNRPHACRVVFRTKIVLNYWKMPEPPSGLVDTTHAIPFVCRLPECNRKPGKIGEATRSAGELWKRKTDMRGPSLARHRGTTADQRAGAVPTAAGRVVAALFHSLSFGVPPVLATGARNGAARLDRGAGRPGQAGGGKQGNRARDGQGGLRIPGTPGGGQHRMAGLAGGDRTRREGAQRTHKAGFRKAR